MISGCPDVICVKLEINIFRDLWWVGTTRAKPPAKVYSFKNKLKIIWRRRLDELPLSGGRARSPNIYVKSSAKL